MKKYILTIDEGTTSLRVALFDTEQKKIIKLSRSFIELIEPKEGWVEIDANKIWSKTISCLKQVTKKIDLDEIYGLGITNQRETVIAWNKKTGKPLYNAIVWKCKRTAKYCQSLKRCKIAKTILNKTGLLINSYFSATKIKWMLENVPNIKKALLEKNLCIGTVESYLVYRLTNGKHFVTDITNASRTMLFNIKTLKWDNELLKYFNIPKGILASEIVDNDKIIGITNVLEKPISIAGLIADQQSSLLGQGCINKGDVKNTYGTGCFMLANIGNKPIVSKNNLLLTIANRINNQTFYALEGSIFSCGSIINDVIEQKVAKNYDELTNLAKQAKNTNLFYIPAKYGLGAPYWKMDVKAKWINKTSKTTKKEIAKAIFWAIAFRNCDVYYAMKKDVELNTKQMCIDGGLTENSYLMQLQSNLLQIPLAIINLESTCMGAIICTGLATKAFAFLNDINFAPSKVFRPQWHQKQVNKKLDEWNKTIKQYLKGK